MKVPLHPPGRLTGLTISILEPEKKRIALLGSFPASWALVRPDGTETRGIEYTSERQRAIIRIEKTAFAPELADLFFHSEQPTIVSSVKLIQSTDIVGSNSHGRSRSLN